MKKCIMLADLRMDAATVDMDGKDYPGVVHNLKKCSGWLQKAISSSSSSS